MMANWEQWTFGQTWREGYMPDPSAKTKMKALVVSRLLMGEINDWKKFAQERDMAGKIANRHAARSVSAQIGRKYRDLSVETKKFIETNFVSCDYGDLARLCDNVEAGAGLYLRLNEFEKLYFRLADNVREKVPSYAHVSISTYGLQFEFPEHHFIEDLNAALEDLQETRNRRDGLDVTNANIKSKREELARLVGREKFLSRSMVSASFSLVEAFLSGLFFTALDARALGKLQCDNAFLGYAMNKESAPLKERLDRIAKFASQGTANGQSEPFKSFIEVGKRFRDAIHHTTPFGRKTLEAGERLLALYEIKADVALRCAFLALTTVTMIVRWLYDDKGMSAITDPCEKLREEIHVYSVKQRFELPRFDRMPALAGGPRVELGEP
jgi:hypothetical protein